MRQVIKNEVSGRIEFLISRFRRRFPEIVYHLSYPPFRTATAYFAGSVGKNQIVDAAVELACNRIGLLLAKTIWREPYERPVVA